jgi:ribonuclease-3
MSTAEDALGSWAEAQLGHRFSSGMLLTEALTHSSAGPRHYERLEFLGDRVLGCIVAARLVRSYPSEGEGQLARRYAALVDRGTCAAVGRSIGLSRHIVVDRSARAARVHELENVVADVCEAVIGALFLDGGLQAAEAFVGSAWAPLIRTMSHAPKDPKSQLQEWAQGKGLPMPSYKVVGRQGPDHAPTFVVEVSVQGLGAREASGSSKQEAEKLAAEALLQEVRR